MRAWGRFRRWIARQFYPAAMATSIPRVDRDGDPIHTERVIRILWRIGAVVLGLLALYGSTFEADQRGFGFITWSIIAASGSALCGALLGLLFGLPTVRRVEIVTRDGADAKPTATASSLADGYSESTNLEQVADWLTKIIVGLTLTQYPYWQARFELLASNVSAAMFGILPDPAVVVPGGALIVAYSALGFLSSYLLMRRYFISEMVQGRKEAYLKAEREREELQVAAGDRRVQEVSVTAGTVAAITEASQSVATKAAAIASPDAKKEAQAVATETNKGADFPDDPWRGQFGGTPTVNGVTLSATISPLESSATNFRVIIQIDAPASFSGQSAILYLHPTFGPDPRRIAFGPGGKAMLEVFAYGAFTVGAILENGDKLELNLATAVDAPEAFRLR